MKFSITKLLQQIEIILHKRCTPTNAPPHVIFRQHQKSVARTTPTPSVSASFLINYLVVSDIIRIFAAVSGEKSRTAMH